MFFSSPWCVGCRAPFVLPYTKTKLVLCSRYLAISYRFMSAIKEHPSDWPGYAWAGVTARAAASAQASGKSWIQPNWRRLSLSREPGQVGKSYLCQHCFCEIMSGTGRSTACSCIHQPFTQTGTHGAAAGSPRRALGAYDWSRYAYWYINTPLNTWALGDPSLPDGALEFPNWDLFSDLLSVQKKKKLILRNASKGQFRHAHWSH